MTRHIWNSVYVGLEYKRITCNSCGLVLLKRNTQTCDEACDEACNSSSVVWVDCELSKLWLIHKNVYDGTESDFLKIIASR